MIEFLRSMKGRFLSVCAGAGALAVTSSVFAEGENGVATEIQTQLNNVGFDSILTTISSTIMPWVLSALGIAITVFVVRLAWSKIRSVMY
ncbi:MAG: hypothetical protein J6J31_12495 [Thermoguttaceae bacterium]|nr:hypothetical protein [Thermoguttaceae bacterium]